MINVYELVAQWQEIMFIQTEMYGMLVELLKCETEVPVLNDMLAVQRQADLRAAIHACNQTLAEINNKIEVLKCGLKVR